MATERLATFLREVSDWRWDEFVRAEKDKQFTTNESIIFALIRACAMQKMEAIKMSLNRLDGKLKTPIRIEYPKIFYLFPNAKALPSPLRVALEESNEALDGPVISPSTELALKPDAPSLGLRDTLVELSEYPRELPEAIVVFARQVEEWLRRTGDKPDEIPLVRSVVAANLLAMAQNRNIDALTEVFDQIDGKLAETIQVVGEDVYIMDYSDKAPPGAYLNGDGVLEIEAPQVQSLWIDKLSKGVK